MVFAERSRPAGPTSRSKDHGCASPHRLGAVTAKRAKRSGAAAKRLDGDGPMWPRALRCVNPIAACGQGEGERLGGRLAAALRPISRPLILTFSPQSGRRDWRSILQHRRRGLSAGRRPSSSRMRASSVSSAASCAARAGPSARNRGERPRQPSVGSRPAGFGDRRLAENEVGQQHRRQRDQRRERLLEAARPCRRRPAARRRARAPASRCPMRRAPRARAEGGEFSASPTTMRGLTGQRRRARALRFDMRQGRQNDVEAGPGRAAAARDGARRNPPSAARSPSGGSRAARGRRRRRVAPRARRRRNSSSRSIRGWPT